MPEIDRRLRAAARADRRHVEAQRERGRATARARRRAAGRSDSRRRRDEPSESSTPDLVAPVALHRRRRAAARICRSISPRRAAPCPRLAGSTAATPSMSSAPYGDRHLRELRTVQRPVHLDERDAAAPSGAPAATVFTSSYPVAGASTGSRRGSGANARKRRRLALQMRGPLDQIETIGRSRARRSSLAARPDRHGAAARTDLDRILGDRQDDPAALRQPLPGPACGARASLPAPESLPAASSRSRSENAVSGVSPAARRPPRTTATARRRATTARRERNFSGLDRPGRQRLALSDVSTRTSSHAHDVWRTCRAASPSMPDRDRDRRRRAALAPAQRHRASRQRHRFTRSCSTSQSF